MIPHLERVVDAIAQVPRGVGQADLLAAVLEGARQGPSAEVANLLLDAVAIAYDQAAGTGDPRHVSNPLHLTVVDKPLRQVQHEARKAVDLGATPRQVLGFVANGLTGRLNGPVERAAADRMAAGFDDAVRTVPVVKRGRDTFRTWPCRDDGHGRCRGGARGPSGWMPCTCTCHQPEAPS